MAAKFEAFVRSDPRFDIPHARHLGMVVFRLIGENELTEKLLKKLNSSGKLHCVPASLKGTYVIRWGFLIVKSILLWNLIATVMCGLFTVMQKHLFEMYLESNCNITTLLYNVLSE